MVVFSSPVEEEMKMGLSVDEQRCIGCGACERACAYEHFGEEDPEMARLRVLEKADAPGTYRIIRCDECGVCMDLCPKGAIEMDPLGRFCIVEDRCTGCGNCAASCPRRAVFIRSSLGVPFKCTGCGACVEACPQGALTIKP